MPSRIGYALAVLCVVAAIAIDVVLVLQVVHLATGGHGTKRLVAPGSVTVHAAAGKRPSIFLETHSVIGGHRYDAPDDASRWTITVHRSGGGTVPIDHPAVTETYSLPGHVGRRIARIDTGGKAGDYVVDIRPVEGTGTPIPTVFAIGGIDVGRLVLLILAIVAATLVGISAAVAVAIVTALRRSSARRQQQLAGLGMAGPIVGPGSGGGAQTTVGTDRDRR